MTGGDGDASPLGRYDEAPEDGEPVEVHLLGTPVELMLTAREHHDGLMREFRLLALSEDDRAPGTPQRLLALTDLLGRQYAAAQARRDADVDGALARGDATVDLHYSVTRSIVDAVRRLDALMAEADAFCAGEQLMTLERSPEVKRFTAWYLDQFTAQCAGADPVPWAG